MRRQLAILSTLLIFAYANSESCDIIIIGAGVSGLAAASLLRAQPKPLDVCILEGRDRVGGRVHSVPSTTHTGVFFEMVYTRRQSLCATICDFR